MRSIRAAFAMARGRSISFRLFRIMTNPRRPIGR
jgi:hypothetical protein